MNARRISDRLHRIADRISIYTSRLSVDEVISDTQRAIDRLDATADSLRRRASRQYDKSTRYSLLGDEDVNNAARAERVAAKFRDIVS